MTTQQATPPSASGSERAPEAGMVSLQKKAWIIIWASFIAFCLLVFATAFLAKSYYDTATLSQKASVSVIRGSALVKGARQAQWSSIPEGGVVKEGDSLMTDETSQVFLRLPDYSTVQLLSASEIKLKQIAVSRRSPKKEFIEMELVRGKAHIGVAYPNLDHKSFMLRMGSSRAHLQEGTYSAGGGEEGWQLRVGATGSARVQGKGKQVSVPPGKRVEVLADGGIGEPQDSLQELVYNGDFSRGLDGWQQGTDLPYNDVSGQVSLVLDRGKPAAEFVRTGSGGVHGDTYLYQEINKDVSDLSSLQLALELKITSHSLPGGGYLGSEYPVIVRVNYRTANGDRTAGVGFYTHNQTRNRTDNGHQVEPDTWTFYKHPHPENLMTLNPPPQRILSVQVSASGWDYESLVRGVSLGGK